LSAQPDKEQSLRGQATVPKDAFTSAFSWLASNALKSLAVMAALSFAVVETVYSFFYISFGIRPDEVGIDRSTIIARALFGMVYFLAVAVALIGFCSLPIRALTTAIHKRRSYVQISSPDVRWLVAAFLPLIPVFLSSLPYISSYIFMPLKDKAAGPSQRALQPGSLGFLLGGSSDELTAIPTSTLDMLL
jgi:hypothetical protein